MRHHFQDHRYGFGVSSPLWDAIMGTLPRSRKTASPSDRGHERQPT
jgi:sterol desaturase/sphingolipid hydroxylase (fatty acid hydroxylase superfamily)